MITINATAKCPKCGADMVPLFAWNAIAGLYWKCTDPDCNHTVKVKPGG